MNIILSAGHNKKRPGVVIGGETEFHHTTKWIKRIYEFLDGEDVGVDLVTGDSLTGTVRQVNDVIPRNRSTSNLAVELHFNSAPVKAFGSETLYHPTSILGKEIATKFQDKFSYLVIDQIQRDRGIKPGYFRTNSENKPLYFLRMTSCPALIIEPLFFHQILVPGFDWKLVADCIAISLLQFSNWDY